MKKEQVLSELMMMECEECKFRKICDEYMYNSDICFCSILINEIEAMEWWDERKEEIITMRDLGFGEDDTPAKYVKVGNTKGYLGAILGIEGYWTVIICNKYGRANKYKAISVKNLNEIKEIDKYE